MKFGNNYSWGRHLDIPAIEARVAKEIAEHEARQQRQPKKPSAVVLPFKRPEVTR
ncbi:hypothetical protein [Phyllobacterium chamaecytisi]|uniref:hypothetical protein n=1 Tax=Phyllobacterium chamaecytisi TaxID=2876082 RepID=UPI001CCAC418|nr:hypothetical protein [Phyllobacterium sp. KW56]MBZ9603995.1 hypothetical protein [Phyllobacterium sp. KW56]